ncbi:MAG: hypothetical protein JNL38_12330 [Myxococcales bacterium]|nr:hypothetical protein [Myxococcales bacterium]
MASTASRANRARPWVTRRAARAAALPALAIVAGCHGAAPPPPPAPRERLDGPDPCALDGGAALDDAARALVRATWVELTSGRPPSKIEHLRSFGEGRCARQRWVHVAPRVTPRDDDGPCPDTFALFMPELGSVELDPATGRGHVAEPGEDVAIVPLAPGRRVVTRRFRGAVSVTLEEGDAKVPVPAASDGAGVVRKIDDRRVVLDGAILDLQTRASLPAKDASVFVPAALAPMGLAATAGQALSPPHSSFIADGRGRVIARLAARSIPAMAVLPLGSVGREEGAAIATFDDVTRTLELVTFVSGAVTRRAAVIDAGPLTEGTREMWLRGVGTRDAVALGLAHKLVVWRLSESAPIVAGGVDSGASARGAEAVFVLEGGRVVVATSEHDTVVVDAASGAVLARGPSTTARYTRSAAMLEDAAAPPERRAVVVLPDGAVRRGSMGSTAVGRFSIPTYVDRVDPWLVCDARALTRLPPIVMYPMAGSPLRRSGSPERTLARGDAYAIASTLGIAAPPVAAGASTEGR